MIPTLTRLRQEHSELTPDLGSRRRLCPKRREVRNKTGKRKREMGREHVIHDLKSLPKVPVKVLTRSFQQSLDEETL